MSTQEIANRLVELCRQGQYSQAYQELFADNAVAIEPEGAPVQKTEGLQALLGKAAQFAEMTEEFFGNEVSDPVVADNYFAVRMWIDSKMKGQPRMSMDELCLYQVKDGKIVQEQFFYTMPPMG